MFLDSPMEAFLKLFKSLAAVGQILVNKEDLSKEGVILCVYLNGAVVAFIYNSLLCHLFSPSR